MSLKSLHRSSRSWCYTLNNYSETTCALLQTLPCRYHVYGREVAPTTSTPHLQGFVMYVSAKSFKTVLKQLNNFLPSKGLPCSGFHLEASNVPHKAAEYCKKDNSFWEFGTPPVSKRAQGEMGAQVYADAIASAKKGKFDEISPMLLTKHYSTYHRMFADSQVVLDSMDVLDFHWYWGPTGTGKSRKAREENPGAYLKNPNKWWDGYVGQSCVIIDEWSPCHSVLAPHLKQWADHHAFAAEVKGGSKCLRPIKIIITSNFSIEQCFPDPADHLPLQRRFQVTHFNDLYKK